MAYTVNRQSGFKYHIWSNYSVACHKETIIKLLWRTSFQQVLGPLFIFSGELLFFSFYCERVWGQCLMPLGKPGPVTPLFAVSVFFFKHLWSGLGGHHSQGCHEYIPSRLTYGHLPFHHAPSAHPPFFQGQEGIWNPWPLH